MKNSHLKEIIFDFSNLNKNQSYIKNIQSFKGIDSLLIDKKVTYFVGENGTGKSTLIESIAESFGFNKEGGTINSNYKTNETDNNGDFFTRLSWKPTKYNKGFFFRGESVYNFINYLENIDDGLAFSPYGGKKLHKFSHGEQFIKLLESMIDNKGFYILDEIESALSPANQIRAVELIKYMVEKGSQFIIVTHSPIILSIENSDIYSLDYGTISKTDFDMVPCVDIYKRFFTKK